MMRKLIGLLLITILVTIIAGCDGGESGSHSSLQDQKATLSAQLVGINLDLLEKVTQVSIASAFSGTKIVTKCYVIPPNYQVLIESLHWVSDGEGGYTAEGSYNKDFYEFELTYGQAVVRLSIRATQNGEEVYYAVIEGNKDQETNLWSGEGFVEGLEFAGVQMVNMVFTNLSIETGSGSYTFLLGEKPCASFTVTYEPDKVPSDKIGRVLHIRGSYNINEQSETIDDWYNQFLPTI